MHLPELLYIMQRFLRMDRRKGLAQPKVRFPVMHLGIDPEPLPHQRFSFLQPSQLQLA
ncbi:hypothetical protein D3C73_1596890 [compost metagenome]